MYTLKIGRLVLLCLTFAISAIALGQGSNDEKQMQIMGKVTDEYGEPLSSVSVHIVGTTKGSITDLNGNYSLKVDQLNSEISFSLLGFVSQNFIIDKSNNNLNIVLLEDLKKIDEVVVVGYGSIKKSSVATAISSVKPEEFNTGGGRDPLNLMEGKVAGLNISRSNGNNPNSSSQIQLRGLVSLVGRTGPLIVVDGIPGGNLDLIQPDDIQSFEVLKDGSAASIYGSMANAGVILITTKQGKAGMATIDYSTYFTRYYLSKRPNFMNAEQYRAYKADPNNSKSGSMTDYGYDTDFYDEMLNHDNLTQYHNLAISGGSEAMNYRGSLYYNDYNGIAKENSRKNYGGRVSLNGKAFMNKIHTQINLATNYNDANLLGGGGWESSLSRNPTQAIYREDGTFWEDPLSINEIARLSQEKYERIQQTNSLDAKLGYSPIQDLNINISGSLQRNNYTDNMYKDRDSRTSIDDLYEGLGVARKSTSTITNTSFEPTTSYLKTLNEKHNINAVAGYSYRYQLIDNFSAENSGFLNDAFEENNLGAGSELANGKAKVSSHKEDETLIAFFGRMNYTFKDKYIAQFSLRREGSSKFGDNYKWGNFPAISTAWNVTNEEFMKSNQIISNLKLRVGYGITGNSGIGNYNSVIKLGPGGSYIFPDGSWGETYGPTTNPNKNLRWERKKELNFGIDFGIMKNRISGTIDIYERRTVDLLENYLSQLPPNINKNIYTNVGTISNSGIEITLNTVPISKKNFTWNSDLTFSTSSNKLVSFSNDIYSIDYKEYAPINGYGGLGMAIRVYEGDDIGNFYGKRFAGLDSDGKWLFYTKNGDKVKEPLIEEEDLTIIGNAIPKVYLAWSNYFKYKNFDFTISFRGKFGFDVLNNPALTYGNSTTLPTNVLNSVKTTYAQLDDTYQYSDYYIESGNFIKLDNVTVGYNFNNKKNRKVPPFRVYVTGRDLLTFTNYSGVDPEVRDTGLGGSPGLGIEQLDRYPITRSFTVGLNITF